MYIILAELDGRLEEKDVTLDEFEVIGRVVEVRHGLGLGNRRVARAEV